MDILSFLKNHTIVSIGKPITDICVAAEVISDDPFGLIQVALEHNCYISEIRFWDRVKMSETSSLGYGGPRDPREAGDTYFAETDICRCFSPKTTYEEYRKYLHDVQKAYPNHELYPAFDIERKQAS